VNSESKRKSIMSDEERPRVVLADDHPGVLIAFGRMLKACCDVVASVSSGSEAVEAVSRLRPHVLVVDLMMPDVNGLEVCRRVKQVSPETQVVIVTAFDDTQVQTIALHDGATAFVAKNQAAVTLAETIQRIFATRQGHSSRID
jgi:DNA-binding NarL/FixJ family response regulator